MPPATKPPFDEKLNEQLGRFQQSYFEFWAREYSIENEKYLLDHPELHGLIMVFLCKLLKLKPFDDVREFAVRHFTRPIEVLEQEVRQYLKLAPTGPYRTSKVPRFKMDVPRQPTPTRQPSPTPTESTVMSPEKRSSLLSDDILRSSFLSLETSVTTLMSAPVVKDIRPVTIQGHVELLMNKIFETAFLRTVVSRDILIDGIFYIVQDCADRAVDIVLAGVVEDIGELIHSAYERFEFLMEKKKRWLNTQMDKTSLKAYRLKTGFKGYERVLEDDKKSAALTMTVSDIGTVVQMRKSTYNRYDKDKFGVYTSNEMKNYVESLTVPPKTDDSEGDEKIRKYAKDTLLWSSTKSKTYLDSLQYLDRLHFH